MKESEITKLKHSARINWDIAIILYMFAMVNAFWNMGMWTLAPNRLFGYSMFLSILPILTIMIYIIVEEYRHDRKN